MCMQRHDEREATGEPMTVPVPATARAPSQPGYPGPAFRTHISSSRSAGLFLFFLRVVKEKTLSEHRSLVSCRDTESCFGVIAVCAVDRAPDMLGDAPRSR